MRVRHYLHVFFALSLFSLGNASAAVIDFNELTEGDTQNAPDPTTVVSGGFSFTNSYDGGDPAGYFIITASTIDGLGLAFCPGCTTTVTNNNGELFSFDSAWIYSLASPLSLLTVTGYGADGRVLTRSFDARTPVDLTINGGWTGLERLEFTGTNAASHFGNVIDNVGLTVVPIPAAAWLFASGLGLLGLRKKFSPAT